MTDPQQQPEQEPAGRAPGERREPADPPKFDAPKGVEDSGRFSAYDTTYGKYVGGVHDSKAKAREAAKDAGATTVEIVEV